MDNMDHCRFENTLNHLYDCFKALRDMDEKTYKALSKSEQARMWDLIAMASDVVDEGQNVCANLWAMEEEA